MNTQVCAFIFARGGSKGVPGKNIRLLGGKPLIAHAIELGKKCRSVDRVIVSTDSEDIARVARDHGAEVPFLRPAELAGDKAPEWLAWQHAIRKVRETGIRCDTFLSLPATSPLRAMEDVANCLTELERGGHDIVMTVKEASRNPYFNMVTMDASRRARLVCGDGRIQNRQEAPAVYDVTTVAYAARADFILNSKGMFDGRAGAVVVPDCSDMRSCASRREATRLL